MSSITNELNKILKNVPPNRHSYFQIQYFIIGKEPTLQGKLWQCLRELKSRREVLESIELESEEIKDNIELSDIYIERLELELESEGYVSDERMTQLAKKEFEIQIKKEKRKKAQLESSLKELELKEKNTLEETDFFINIYKAIREKEPLQDFDSKAAQTAYWNAKLSEKLHLNQIMNSPSNPELIATILALPDETPIKKETVYTIEKIQEKLIEKKASKGGE